MINRIGYDISHWQGSVNFQTMKASGGSFVIMKASQGVWEDPKFDENWKAAKGVLPRGSYHYYDNRYPPKEQAQKYFDTIKHDLEGPCVLDLEDRQVGIYSGWRGWYDFLVELERLYPGATIVIYSNFYYIVEMLSVAKVSQRQYFAKFLFWLASYQRDPFNPNYADILCPLPWPDYIILQSGTPVIGPAAGVESLEIDYNIWRGTEEQFQQLFKAASVPPTEGDPMAVSQWYKVTASVLNIRSGPGTSYSDVGDLLLSDVIEVTENIGGWLHIVSIYRGGVRIPEPALAWC
jgi:hypothetical protein